MLYQNGMAVAAMRKNKGKRGTSAERLFMLLCGIVSCALFLLADLPQAEAVRSLRIGTVEQEPQFFQADAQGTFSGYGYEYMQMVAGYGDWEPLYVPGTWAQCVARLASGEIDVLLGAIHSPQNDEAMDFSVLPMYTTYSNFYFHGGTDGFLAHQEKHLPMRFGQLSGYGGEGVLDPFALRYLPLGTVIDYEDEGTLQADYQAGSIDGAFLDHRYAVADDPVMNLRAVPVYLAIRKGNEEIARLLWPAEQAMVLDYPQCRSQLYKKYFKQGNRHAIGLALTQEETDYLQKKQKLRMVAIPGEYPHSGFINGKFEGDIAKLVDRMRQDLGIEIEVIETKSSNESFQMVRHGEADVMTEFFTDHTWARQNGLRISVPYLEMDYVEVTRHGGYSTEHPRVAVSQGHYYVDMFVKPVFGEDSLVWCENMDDCLRAVDAGRADMAFVKASVAQYMIFNGGYFGLVTGGEIRFSHDISFAVDKTADRRLLGILNKEISSLDANFLSTLDTQQVLQTKGAWNIRALVYNYPMHFFLGTALIALALLISLIYFHKMRRKHLEHIQKVAYTDHWTGLRNWLWFEERVPALIDVVFPKECKEGRLVVLYITMQRIELLDAAYGHEFVSQQLLLIIQRMEREIPSIKAIAVSGLAGRILVLDLIQEDDDTYRRKIERMLSDYGTVNTEVVNQTIVYKAGISRVTSSAMLANAIYSAETACSELHDSASSVRWFDQELEHKLSLHQQIEALMGKALVDHEFKVWYQPKYDIRTHKTVGAEALVRWQSPEMGFLMPGKFIDIFETNGFILKLDFYNLEEVCSFQRDLLDHGQEPVCVSVNMSRMHILEPDYLDRIREIKEKYNLPDGLIELELTETAFSVFDQLGKRQKAIDVVRALHEMGYAISMDDFGSGYSSMELLNILPLDVMKIDRTLLLGDDMERVEKVLAGSIALGKSLGMKVLCEGIEEPEQEEILLRSGCHYGQGYIFSKPLPQDKFEQFLKEH